MVTNYVYPSAQVGEFRQALLYASGPASYASSGDPVYNPGANEYINFPSSCSTLSGNYDVTFSPTDVGLNIVRAGAPAPSQSGWTARWSFKNVGGGSGVATATSSGGSGMTAGTYALSIGAPNITGGVQAVGYITVTTSAVTALVITNPGSGYTSAPTTTATTGGTPPTLTAHLAVAGAEVAAGANLSAELIQFGAVISSL